LAFNIQNSKIAMPGGTQKKKKNEPKIAECPGTTLCWKMLLPLTVDARNLYLYFHGWLFLAGFYLLHVLPSFFPYFVLF